MTRKIRTSALICVKALAAAWAGRRSRPCASVHTAAGPPIEPVAWSTEQMNWRPRVTLFA
jgi:hypothetical protein